MGRPVAQHKRREDLFRRDAEPVGTMHAHDFGAAAGEALDLEPDLSQIHLGDDDPRARGRQARAPALRETATASAA